MKRSILFFFAFILVLSSFAAPNNKVIKSGLWTNATNWSLNRIPQVGDTITVPSTFTISVNDDRIFDGFVYLQVFGTLEFEGNNSTLSLNDLSSIYVMNGVISGSGTPSQKIKLAGTSIFNGAQPPITGYQIANSSTSGFVVCFPYTHCCQFRIKSSFEKIHIGDLGHHCDLWSCISSTNF